MKFSLEWTQEARTAYDEMEREANTAADSRDKSGKTKSSKQEGLFKQVQKCIRMLKTNPRHPGLETHPYSSLLNPYDKNQKVFEACAQQHSPGAYRVFWCYGPTKGKITLITITPHP